MTTPKQFYYKVDGAVIGPVTGIMLRDAAITGVIDTATPVAGDPHGAWVGAGRVRGLFDENGKPLPHPPETEQLLKANRETPRLIPSGKSVSQIDDLLDRWEEFREAGRSISIEELCQDCPELQDALRQQIRELEWVDGVMATQDSSGNTVVDGFEIPKALGRFRLDEQIGEGGFGQVWKGFDPKLERNVAIKVLKPDRSRSISQVDRFLSEARKVARLRHKNIVAVYETDHDGKWYFMVTDWINGRDLAHRLSISRPSFEESVCIIAKVADALQYAHDQGIIHRDVKPHNIVLDRDWEPYITDFGIAVTESELLDDSSDTSGTPAYMAPEQACFVGPAVDPRTDVYSLGVVLYELLVGKVPHTASTLAMLRSSFKSKPIPSLSVENPNVSPELERVCLKAMAIDMSERWRSAKEFATHLRRTTQQEAVQRSGDSSDVELGVPSPEGGKRVKALEKELKELRREQRGAAFQNTVSWYPLIGVAFICKWLAPIFGLQIAMFLSLGIVALVYFFAYHIAVNSDE
ncbi:MAG: serine/threonine protein kinase [Planctomycetaceae bacterium]|nr:serine/threonine protein kinase [Planctomycetales bacterium]MCB9925512.1 serine/threonine protein kinase [Planctomycetaceae bacterium]